jgi:hypothetical protein
MKSDKPGEMYMKYLLKFTNEEVTRVRDAVRLSRDRLFPTTQKEALIVTDTSDLVYSLSAMFRSASVNDATLHHFSSDVEFTDEDLEMIVKAANYSESSKEQLMQARIKGV